MWSRNGNSFIVADATRFSELILPFISKHKNFSSFVRQLSKSWMKLSYLIIILKIDKYGFHKVRRAEADHSFPPNVRVRMINLIFHHKSYLTSYY
jgi:hypothetical protein